MPPALIHSDDDEDVADGDDLFVLKEPRQNRRRNEGAWKALATSGVRATRANTELQRNPEAAVSLAIANEANGNAYIEDEDDEEEEEDDDDDGESANPKFRGFLSKPKLPPHRYASRSLSDITRKQIYRNFFDYVSSEYFQSCFRLPILISTQSINGTSCGKVSPTKTCIALFHLTRLGNRMSGLIDSLLGKCNP